MAKFELSREFPYIQISKDLLRKRIEDLQRDNDQLRARVVAAQQEKQGALKQAEEARVEKERLRVKLRELKDQIKGQEKVDETLRKRISDLQEANELLQRKSELKAKRK